MPLLWHAESLGGAQNYGKQRKALMTLLSNLSDLTIAKAHLISFIGPSQVHDPGISAQPS